MTSTTQSNPTTDPTSWDVLSLFYADGEDLERMSKGCHFNYATQTWADGHDHLHYHLTTGEVLFCGADLESCMGIDQKYETVR